MPDLSPAFLEAEARRLELPLSCVFFEDGRLYLTPQGWRRLSANGGAVIEQMEVTRPTPQTVKVRIRLLCKASPSSRTFEAEAPLLGGLDPQSATEIALCRAIRFFLGIDLGIEGDPCPLGEPCLVGASNPSPKEESSPLPPPPLGESLVCSPAASSDPQDPPSASRPERWKRAMRRCHAAARERGIYHDLLSSCFTGTSMKVLEEEELLATAKLLETRDLGELKQVFVGLPLGVRTMVSGVKDLLKGQLGG